MIPTSSFVGLFVISVMVPIPVLMAKLIQKVQVERMKMVSCHLMLRFMPILIRTYLMETDSRVQAVTESKHLPSCSSKQCGDPSLSLQCFAHGQNVRMGT